MIAMGMIVGEAISPWFAMNRNERRGRPACLPAMVGIGPHCEQIHRSAPTASITAVFDVIIAGEE
jgi:hypothetical protein